MKTIKTMQELATYVGLSRQTLSKYFNDPNSISDTTRKTIAHAIAETGFRPNLLARNLKRDKSKLIGIIIPSLIDPYYMQLTNSITAIADEENYFTITLASNGSKRMEAEAINRLHTLNTAGVLIAPLGKTTQPLRGGR